VAGAIEARPHARAAAHSAPSPAPVQPNGSTPPAGAPPVVSGGVATPPVVPPVPIDAPAGTPQPIAAGPAFTKLDAIEPAPAAARPDVAPGAGASHDAPMTGDDESSHDQPRRSPEFLRFATALAQVASDPRAGTGADLNVRLHEPAVVSPSAGVAPSAPPSMSAVAPTAPAAAEATPDAETLGRLVHAMRVSARAGAWEATVRLKPEHLGEVTIALRVERNSVAAVVNAEAAGVRHWLESQEQAVRAGMAEHGLHLDRFVVQRDGQRRDPQEQEPRRRAPKPPPQTGERFEIMV
jgi:flagellar hook-length control protein FliK